MSVGAIDKLLEKKKRQMENEKAALEPAMIEKLQAEDGLLLEMIITKGCADMNFEELDFSKSMVRRLIPALPAIIVKMNEDHEDVSFSLIKGRYAEDPSSVGIKIIRKDRNVKK